MSETFFWWLALEVIGLAGLPLTALVFANLPDRGWTLAKPFSLLILGWLIWFPLTLISALPFNRIWIMLTLLLYLAGNLALVWRVARVRTAIVTFIARHRGYVVFSEVLFAAGFAVMVWERSFTPAVVDTEKFMDVAFLSSIWRAPHLPPPDPWLSGQPINYYYFGHFLVALVAKVLGTVPDTAFNLGVGLIFALTTVALFGVAANLFAVISPTRRGIWRGLVGLTSAGFVLLLGNLNGAQVWWQNAQELTRQLPALYSNPWVWWLHRDVWTRYDWWASSRVIPNTINEFPAFSFALADLHAHVLALPFATVAVGLACNLLLARRAGIHAFSDGRLSLLALLACGVALGGLYAINGWDLPTYLGLALLALAIQQWLAHDRQFSKALLIDFLTTALILGGLCFISYLPFYRDFSSPGEGVGLVPANARTPVGYELAIFGLPLFVLLSLATLRLVKRWPAPGAQIGLAAAAVLLLGSWLAPNVLVWTVLWALLVVGVCAYLAAGQLGLRPGRALPVDALYPDEDARLTDRLRAGAWFWCLVGTAVALIAACELVFLRDVFAGGDRGALGVAFRMNTVFKLYYQAWLLLGIVAGPALWWMLAGALRWLRASVDRASRAEPRPARWVGAASGALLLRGGEGATASLSPSDPLGRLASVVPPDNSAPAGTEIPGQASIHYASRRTGPVALRALGTGGIVLWVLICLALIGAATIYPIMATAARTANFTLTRSLDGTAYMSTDPANQGDAQAIAWLNAHVTGDPVIVEGARYDEYTHYGRISAFTGLPTLMGWGGHEYQWRYNWVQQPGRGDITRIVRQRLDAVTKIYTDASAQHVLALLHQYTVRYVYVGVAEYQLYPTADLRRFATFLRVVYHSADVTIYAVP
jgi:YYY domain-containing protein